MCRSTGILVLFTVAAFGLAGELRAGIIPPIGLAPGSQYQLAFVTSDWFSPTSANIADYNQDVNAEAALNPSLPSTTWTAVVSTPTVSANQNAPWSSGLPVYNTQGILVSSGAAGFYSETVSHVAPIQYNQFGNAGSPGPPGSDEDLFIVLTGSTDQGTPLYPAGTALIGVGDSANTVGWANLAVYADYGPFPPADWPDGLPLYALSGVLTVPTPEPTSIALVGTGLLGFGGVCLCRRRRVSTMSS